MRKKVVETLKDIAKANVWDDRTEYDKEDLAKAYPDLTAKEVEELDNALHCNQDPCKWHVCFDCYSMIPPWAKYCPYCGSEA